MRRRCGRPIGFFPRWKNSNLSSERRQSGGGSSFILFFYFDSILFIYFFHALLLTACLFAGGPRARLPRGNLVPSFRTFVFVSAADVVSSGAAVHRDCRRLCVQLALSVIQTRLSERKKKYSKSAQKKNSTHFKVAF